MDDKEKNNVLPLIVTAAVSFVVGFAVGSKARNWYNNLSKENKEKFDTTIIDIIGKVFNVAIKKAEKYYNTPKHKKNLLKAAYKNRGDGSFTDENINQNMKPALEDYVRNKMQP